MHVDCRAYSSIVGIGWLTYTIIIIIIYIRIFILYTTECRPREEGNKANIADSANIGSPSGRQWNKFFSPLPIPSARLCELLSSAPLFIGCTGRRPCSILILYDIFSTVYMYIIRIRHYYIKYNNIYIYIYIYRNSLG